MKGRRVVLGALLFAATLAVCARAQSPAEQPPETLASGGAPAGVNPAPDLVAPMVLPRMAPELALVSYEKRAARQSSELGGLTNTVVIKAELPDTRQEGEYQLKRYFFAPKYLSFSALKFVGDSFVKTNVILRLLQSEQDHVVKDKDGDVSISTRNYRFYYKRTEVLAGRTVHVYQVRPLKKRVGLFKGQVYIDAYRGSLVRAEGTVVKSPSWFVKKIDFVQEYADFGDFTLPVHIHSNAKARIIGRTVVDIYHRDYEPQMVELVQHGTPAAQN